MSKEQIIPRFRGFWSEINDSVLETVLTQCKGHYQESIVLGIRPMSGSDLKGKARKYSSRYKQSIYNLITRLRACGLNVFVKIGWRGRNILVVEK